MGCCFSTTETPLRTITLDEVLQHQKDGDCWIMANGYVYDVSMLMLYHPSNATTFLDMRGRDSADQPFFNDPTYRGEWNTWLIGKFS